MSLGKWRTAATMLSLSLGSLAVVSISPSGATAESTPLPALLDDTSPSGKKITSAQVLVVPPTEGSPVPGETRALLPVPAQLNASGARFSVGVDPEAIPARMRGAAPGVVDFILYLEDSDGTSWSTSFSGRGVWRSNTQPMLWLDPGKSSEHVSKVATERGYPALKAVSPTTTRSTSVSADEATETDDPYDYDDETIDVPEDDYVVTPRLAGDCLRETYKRDANRSTTVATSYPINATVSWITHRSTSSSESTFGIGVSTNGGSTWKGSGTRYTESSWSGTWSASSNMRSYRIQVNYHKYILGEGCHGEVQYWRPHIETGGASTNQKGLSRPSWNTYCAPQPKGFTFVRDDASGNAYSYGAAVKFASMIGIDLSIKRIYKSSQSLSYRFPEGDGTRRHRLCGNNDYPSMAGKMIDRLL